jgi:hypothetical protein
MGKETTMMMKKGQWIVPMKLTCMMVDSTSDGTKISSHMDAMWK